MGSPRSYFISAAFSAWASMTEHVEDEPHCDSSQRASVSINAELEPPRFLPCQKTGWKAPAYLLVILLFFKDKLGRRHSLYLAKATSPSQIPPHDVARWYSALYTIPQLEALPPVGSCPFWVLQLCALGVLGPCTFCRAQGNVTASRPSHCSGFYS